MSEILITRYNRGDETLREARKHDDPRTRKDQEMTVIKTELPRSLRIWFVIHFAADMAFAVPLFLAPRIFLGALGWSDVDPVTTRLVAAALFGIGIQSLLGRNETAETFRAMLNLKIIWSMTAVAGLVWSALDGGPEMTWVFVVIFAGFSVVWWRYRLSLRSIRPASTP